MKKYLTGRSAAIAVSLILSGQFLLPASAYAEDEYVCEARQSSNDELPVLSKGCPIGKGLWGKMQPAKADDLFWIQCGIFPEALTPEEVKPIYEKISVDVWLKPEGKGYRCLIGPYDDYAIAREEVVRIRSMAGYKESFVRTVNTKAKPEPARKKATLTPPAKAKAAEKPKAKPVPKPAAPAPQKVTKKEPELKAMPDSGSAGNSETIVMRREATIDGKKYVIPFLMEGDEQFYMEYSIAWNRLSYEKSGEVCKAIGMSLVNEQEWKRLIDSNVMSDKQWPLHLPYWGEGKRGLFTSGKVTQLTGTSLLNVVCVK